MILMGIVKHSQNFQNSKFSMFLQYIQDVKDEIDFVHADKHQSFLKNTLGIKISYKVDVIIINGHNQAFSSYSVTSLQYINISKKKLGMEVIFGMQIIVKGSTSWYYPFWWKWSDMSKIPKIGSWKYCCNILKKIVATALCSVMIQNIFCGAPVMFVVTCFLLEIIKGFCDFAIFRAIKWRKFLFLDCGIYSA